MSYTYFQICNYMLTQNPSYLIDILKHRLEFSENKRDML